MIPDRSKKCSLFLHVQTVSRAIPTPVLYVLGSMWPGPETDHSLPPSAKMKTECSCTSVFLYKFLICKGQLCVPVVHTVSGRKVEMLSEVKRDKLDKHTVSYSRW